MIKLTDRSPGYVLKSQEDHMRWPDLKSNPYLNPYIYNGNNNHIDFSLLKSYLYNCDFKKICNELTRIKYECNLHNEIHKIFFERFIVELRREFETLSMRKLPQLPLSKLSEKSNSLAKYGYYIDSIDNDIIKHIRDLLKLDIINLIDTEPVRNYREYDRSIFYRNEPIVQYIDNLFTKIGYIEASENYFGFKMHVYSVTLHVCFPDDVHKNQVLSDKKYTTKTRGLHFDPKSGTIKSILYLKDISTNDGPFKFIPGSHNLINPPIQRLSAKANCTTNYLDSDEARYSFMKLPELMRKTSILGTITDDSDRLSKQILEREVELTSDKGNCIIFDPAMLHRGGDCISGYRVSLQIAIRRRNDD